MNSIFAIGFQTEWGFIPDYMFNSPGKVGKFAIALKNQGGWYKEYEIRELEINPEVKGAVE